MLRLVVAAGVMLALPTLALAQDAEAGKKLFAKCAPCHTVGEGAKIKPGAGGPPLNGLDGRAAGTFEGYSYSPKMKASGKTWDEATFKEYITDPKKAIPGNKMGFNGLPDELERDDIWAYLSQFGPDGKVK